MLASVLIIVISIFYKILAKPMNYKFNDDNVVGITIGVILGLLLIAVFIRIVRAIIQPERDYSKLADFVTDLVFLAASSFIGILFIVGYTVKDDYKMNRIMSIVTIILFSVTVLILWITYVRYIIKGYNPIFLLQVYIYGEFKGFIGGIFGGIFGLLIVALSLFQLVFVGIFSFVGLFGIFTDEDAKPMTMDDVIIFHTIMDHIK